MAKPYERQEKRRKQIAQAALELLAESGVRGFTAKGVAEKVGIADATVFKHFGNMQEIVLAAMALLEERMFSMTVPENGDALQRLEGFFRMRAKLLGDQGSLGRLMFSEQLVHAAGEEGVRKLSEWRRRNLKFVTGCLEALGAEGRLPFGLAACDLTVIVQGALLTFAFERGLKKRSLPNLNQRIDTCWRTLSRLIVCDEN